MTKMKNLRKIPKHIRFKLKSFEDIEAVAILLCSKKAALKGRLKKFGIYYQDDKLQIQEKFTPPSSIGKFSHINRFGKVLVRKDLPMITKSFSMEVPNYGDWSKGSHEISYDREVYERERISPPEFSISPEFIKERKDELIFGFRVYPPVNKADKEFETQLLFQLNLLQESFGDCDIIEKGQRLEEKPAHKRLRWEILPPGWWKDKDRLKEIKKRLGSRETNYFFERLKLIRKLGPKESYEGRSYLGNRLYFTFIFDGLVIAECPEFGNALYYLDGKKVASWKQIFSRTKREALKAGAKRLLHMGNWESRLKSLVGKVK